MLEPITEVVYLPLKAGLDLNSGDAKKVWEDTLSTIAKQPGLKTLFWGRQIESPDVVQMAVDWESIDAHKTFMASPIYQPFLNKLGEQLLDGEPTLFHVQLPPSGADNPLHAPITECIAAFFAPEYSQEEYLQQIAQFKQEAAKVPGAELRGLEGGWSVESHKFEDKEEGKEIDGNMFTAFVGWPSVDAHLAFRKSEEFGKIIPLMRGGTKAVKVWHVAFTQYK